MFKTLVDAKLSGEGYGGEGDLCTTAAALRAISTPVRWNALSPPPLPA